MAKRQAGRPRFLQAADVPPGGLVGQVVALTEQQVSERDFAGGTARWVRRERPVLWVEFEDLGRRGLILDGERLQYVMAATGEDPERALGRTARVTLAALLDADGRPTGRQRRVLSFDAGRPALRAPDGAPPPAAASRPARAPIAAQNASPPVNGHAYDLEARRLYGPGCDDDDTHADRF